MGKRSNEELLVAAMKSIELQSDEEVCSLAHKLKQDDITKHSYMINYLTGYAQGIIEAKLRVYTKRRNYSLSIGFARLLI